MPIFIVQMGKYRKNKMFAGDYNTLERISDGKMIAERLTERGHVVVTRFARIVWCVQSNSHIKADNQKLQVVAQTGTGAQSQFLAKVFPLEPSTWTCWVFLGEPYITGIQEDCSEQVCHYRESVFHIALKTYVAHLV